jgi:hypothetical protein
MVNMEYNKELIGMLETIKNAFEVSNELGNSMIKSHIEMFEK